eukprot:TRINITY_DN30329_c0_g1_i1.p1 TRINITY_DN30329_c0_g1~~TRINITY_DN30329_c0_g1_i1.p1  ORF type:complete len:271 (+),score=28.13 TRINITY_DN30329_c0_g1_i1:45-857(+)
MLKVVLLVGLIAACSARKLCIGEECTSSEQCGETAACFARRGERTHVGKCLQTKHARRLGDSCTHKGQCDACSECVNRRCVSLTQGMAGNEHEEVLKHRLESEENIAQNLRGELKNSLAQNHRMKKMLTSSYEKAELHTVAIRFVLIAVVVFTIILLFLIVYRLLLLRRNSVRRQPSTPEPEFYASDSSDSEVPSDTEGELRQEHQESEPIRADLDPEDQNTCKICFDSIINCILLDCGHMCVCMPCAKRLKNCPMCRKLIRKRKKVYKA